MSTLTMLVLACIALALMSHTAIAHTDDKLQLILKGVRTESGKLQPWLLQHRRWLHKTPELAHAETETSAYIRRELKALRIKFRGDIAGNSIVATVGSGAPKVALRAAMDSLPIKEANDTDFVSRFPGRMHAGGNDAHVAMLLGAAKMLKAREASFRGTVMFLFQSAGQSGSGAAKVMSAGVLKGVAAVAGIQVSPEIRSGTVSTRGGPITSASDSFSISVMGQGGLGGVPHNVRNPVVAAAAVISAIQLSATREMDPSDAAVVSISQLHTGGGGGYVIPDSVEVEGGIFAKTADCLSTLRRGVSETALSASDAYGCKAAVSWSSHSRAPITNDDNMADLMEDAAEDVATFQRLESPTTAINDFSAFADETPSVYGFLGIRNEVAGSVQALHTSRFAMDDSQLPTGAALQAVMALRMLDSFTGGRATNWPPRETRTNTINGKRALPARSTLPGRGDRRTVKVVRWQRSFIIDLFTGTMVVLFWWVPLPALELHTVVTKTYTAFAEAAPITLKTD